MTVVTLERGKVICYVSLGASFHFSGYKCQDTRRLVMTYHALHIICHKSNPPSLSQVVCDRLATVSLHLRGPGRQAELHRGLHLQRVL